MRNLFPGHYRPTRQQFDELWKSAVFVLDTNVLLNLYRYSTTTRDRLLEVLKVYKDRLWLPHQVAAEFHRNRMKVIAEQVDAYKKIRGLLDDHRKQIEVDLAAYNRHWFIDTKEHLKSLDKVFESTKAALQGQQEKHPNLLERDPILESITDLFDGRVGNPYVDDTLNSMYKLAEQRYSRRVPPGFMDAKEKSGDEKYGDWIIWQQMIDHAKATTSPVVLVTDDNKEDWWWKFQGKTFGPRPELVEEMRKSANVAFYMYKTDQFMEHAGSTSRELVSAEAINEVRSLSREAAVARRFKEHLSEREARVAERMRDLLHKKTMLEQERASLDQRWNEIATGRDPYDGHMQSMDPSDRRLVADKAALMTERFAVERDRSAINDELKRLSAEVSELIAHDRTLRRRGTGVSGSLWSGEDMSEFERALMTNLFLAQKDADS